MTDDRNRRQSNRTVSLKPTTVAVRGKTYRLHDISPEGIGLIIEDGAALFFSGQRIASIPVSTAAGTRYLKGVVAHISRTHIGQVCGIRFLFESAGELDHVKRFRQERELPAPDPTGEDR